MLGALVAVGLFGGAAVLSSQSVLAADSDPKAPSACTATRSVDRKSVNVEWKAANKDQAARYVVERRRNNGSWYWAGRAEAPKTQLSDKTLRSQDQYKFRVYTRTNKGKISGVRPCVLVSASKTPATTKPTTEPTPVTTTAPKENTTPVTTAKQTTTTVKRTTTTAKPAIKNPVSNAGPVPVPQCGTYWGSYVNSRLHGGGTDAAAKLRAINKVESTIGRTFDIDHQFYRWDDFANQTNLDRYVKKSAAEGRIPFLSWKPVYKDGTNISWASIANGQHDKLIREKARLVKSLNMPVFISFDHEANARVGDFQPGNTGGGHIKADAGSEAQYVAAWRQVHKIYEQEGVTNVSWVWLMSRTPFANGGAFADRLYPGDTYVDWVGLDPYNFFHGGRTWSHLEPLMQDFTKWVERRNINKPWMLGEWGSVEDPNQSGRKAQWYHNAANYIESENRLKAVVHFESNPEYNWRYDSSTSSKSAFAAVGNRNHFKQSC